MKHVGTKMVNGRLVDRIQMRKTASNTPEGFETTISLLAFPEPEDKTTKVLKQPFFIPPKDTGEANQ